MFNLYHICNVHLIIFIWNLRDKNLNYYYYKLWFNFPPISFLTHYYFSLSETRVINMELHYPFLYFSLDDILLLISCILTQQRIVFLSSSYSLLTPIIEVCVISLFLYLLKSCSQYHREPTCFALFVQIYAYQTKKIWPKPPHEHWIWRMGHWPKPEIKMAGY